MAGSWNTGVIFREGYLNGSTLKPVGAVKSFTADAADGSIPAVTVEAASGLLTGIEVEFDETTPPNALTVVLKTIGGITVVTGGTLTASGLIDVYPPFDCCGGYILEPTGNTTNGARATIICKFR